MILKKLSKTTYRKLTTTVDTHQVVNTTLTGEFSGLFPFLATEQRKVTLDEYSAGKLRLLHTPISVQAVTIIKDNQVLINQDANATTTNANFKVVNDLVGFKNNVDLYGIVTNNLDEVIQADDLLTIVYQYSVEQKYYSYTFNIDTTAYTNGYVTLPKATAFPEHCMAFMNNGSMLLNAYQSFITNAQPDFIIVHDKFIFKNNVDVGYCITTNLSEFIQEGDTITVVLIY